MPDPGPANVIRRWDDFGFGPATDLPASRDTILDIRPVPGGGAVFSAEDPGWGRIAPDGSIASRPAPPMADLRPAREQRLAVSADGTVGRVRHGRGPAALRRRRRPDRQDHDTGRRTGYRAHAPRRA